MYAKNTLIQKAKNYIFLILFVVSYFKPINYFGQSASDNHRKYWYYRSRLTNDFLKVGRNAGESIPFMQRGKDGSGLIYYPWPSPSVNPDLGGGDHAGAIGYYIAVLATEYKLLKQNNQNTDKVKHELFCALEAIDRIDYKAETVYPTFGGQGILNGFYIRDDFDKNFVRGNYKHFNYFSNWSPQNPNDDPPSAPTDRGFASKAETGMYKTYGSWQGYVADPNTFATTFSSQDNTYNILFGLAFVNKFVPTYETDGANLFAYGSNESSLTIEARNITKRLINFIRNPTDLNNNDCLSPAEKIYDSWRIRYPDNCNTVLMGDDARPFSYPLGELESILTNGPLSAPATNLLNIPRVDAASGYHNSFSTGAGYLAWNLGAATTQLYNPANASIGMDTRVFITNISAMCNCVYQTILDTFVQETIWFLQESPLLSGLGVIIGWAWKLVSAIINIFVPGKYLNATSSSITLNAYPYLTPLDHGPIAHAVLNDIPTYYPNPQYTMDNLLNSAPCDNIYNFGANNKSTYEWSSDLRLDHPNRRGMDAGGSNDGSGPKGEYNGLDYLLYHNLHYLFQSSGGSINQNITDLSDVYINQPTNFNSNVNAYETINVENTSLSNPNLTYWRAGKTIMFKPGTFITGSNNLHAYIQKFDCATDIGQFRLMHTDTVTENNDSYPESTYHYQNYPVDLNVQPANINDEHFKNLITEQPIQENPFDKLMKEAYPEYTKELFVKPTITESVVRVYFRMDDNELAFIHLMDVSGKIVYSKRNIEKNETGFTIDLSLLSNGVYMLKFTTTKGTSKTQKLIKN